MLQRLPIAFEQIKGDNTFENLLNEIRHIIYFLYWGKEITKRHIIVKWIQKSYKTKWMLYL